MSPAIIRSTRAVAVALIAAIVILAVPATGAAVDDPADLVPPTLLTPPEGGQSVAGTPVVFRIVTHPNETHSLYVRVSRSPAVDAEGVIGSDESIRNFSAVPDQPGVYEAAPTYYSFSSFWMNAPGVHYWQAYRIHCAINTSDCLLESPVRALVVTPRPVTAQILAVGPTRACYISRSRVHVTAVGFKAGSDVTVRFAGRSAGAATADAFGHVDTSVLVPSAGIGPVQRRFLLSVTEDDFTANTASVSVLAANLAFTVRPSFFRRGQKVLLRFSGLRSNRAVYAHYRSGGRTLANVRLGIARGACGLLSVRAQGVPSRIWRRGSWTVQFDSLPRYSPTANPRLRTSLTIRTFG